MRIRPLVLLLTFLTTVPAFASITGTIINSDGHPVAGAKVSIYPTVTLDARRALLMSKTPERTPLVTKQTDSNGSFTFDSPKETVVDLRIDAAGFAPDAFSAIGPAAPILTSAPATGS